MRIRVDGPWLRSFMFREKGSGFRVQGLGFRVWDLEFGVWGSGFGVRGLRVWVL